MHLHVNMQCTGFFISRNSSHSLIPTLLCKIVMECFELILRWKMGEFYTGCTNLMEFWGIVLSFGCHTHNNFFNPQFPLLLFIRRLLRSTHQFFSSIHRLFFGKHRFLCFIHTQTNLLFNSSCFKYIFQVLNYLVTNYFIYFVCF